MKSERVPTDSKTLRERALRDIEDGAVTSGYSANRTAVIKMLNEALATRTRPRAGCQYPRAES